MTDNPMSGRFRQALVVLPCIGLGFALSVARANVTTLPDQVGATPVQPEAAVTQAARPRIGLVLSGGGARGAAHVGVIRALEAMHIPIDAVAARAWAPSWAGSTQPA